MGKSKSEVGRTSTRAPRSRGRGLTVTKQRIPSRLAKRRLGERLKNDTAVKRAFMFNSSDWALNHPQRTEKIASEMDTVARECELMVSGIGD